MCKPFEKNIPKTEVVHLLRDQESDYLGGFFGDGGASQPDSLVHVDHEPSMASLLPRKVLRYNGKSPHGRDHANWQLQPS